MKKTISKLKCLSVVLFILGLACIGTCIGLNYFYGDAEYKIYYIIGLEVALGVFLVLGLFLTLFYSFQLEKQRYQSDLKTVDVLGSDVEAAYNFGEIGMIVTNDVGTILWVNDLLLDRGFNCVDTDMKDFSPILNDMMKNAKSQSHVVFNNKYYDVKYIKAANLFILKDNTLYQDVLKYNDDNLPVIGYLNVDNFSDIPTTDEFVISNIENTIRNEISDYFKGYECLVKGIKPDLYMIFLTKVNFMRMIDDEFSIIKKINDKFENEGLTISLGFGYGSSVYSRNNELASGSLDVALSRGGNQCVVSPSNESMQFYSGGNTESHSKSSKVKLKTYAKSLMSHFDHASNVLIVPHMYADIDAIGACLGIYTLCHSAGLNVDAKILYESEVVETCANTAVRSSLPNEFLRENFISFKKANELKTKDTLIVVVDHNKPSLSIYPDLYAGSDNNVVVIDHHRRQDDCFEDPIFENIETSASSTCELLALYFDALAKKISITPEIATIMLSGIYLDTDNFKVKTSIDTHEAAIILTRLGADETKAREFLKESYEKFDIKSKILANITTPMNGVIIAKADFGDKICVDSALLATVCNELRDVQGTRIVFALGKTSENTIYVSSRGDGTVNCEFLMMKIGGGGHFSAAAASIKDKTIAEVEVELNHILKEYLSDAMKESKDTKKERD